MRSIRGSERSSSAAYLLSRAIPTTCPIFLSTWVHPSQTVLPMASSPGHQERAIVSFMAGHLSNLQKLSKTRYCGTGATVIQTDDQMLLAQQCIGNLRRILLEARKVHSQRDYARMAAPILLEVQQREQEILYLSGYLEQPVAS